VIAPDRMASAEEAVARYVPEVLRRLAYWADTRPDGIAVSALDGELSFAELRDRTESLARRLALHGVGRETSVALLLDRSRDSLPGWLAVWRLGGTVVPLDLHHPPDRIEFSLSDSAATILVGRAGGLPAGLRLGGAVLVEAVGVEPAGTEPDGGESVRGASVGQAPSPADCAYTIYTSGTTGRPKGVEVTYRGLDAFVVAVAGLGLTPGGVGVNAVSPAFDGWLWCTLLALVNGQGVALLDLSLRGAPAQTPSSVFAAVRPRTVSLTPSLLAAYGAEAVQAAEVVVVAGEACPPALAEQYSAGRRFLNVYGPTEATIAATWADTARGDDVRTIGRALPGVRAYVLDEERAVVPDGETGELFLGGAGVARGYRNRPELTADRFLPDPFADADARMYRTGDQVRVRADGLLEYCGRLDDQVKVRGHRIELGEVERVACELPDVVAAACHLQVGGDALGLAVVPSPSADAPTLAARVREHCAARLVEAAVPRTVRMLLVLPTGPTGKVDRDALTGLGADGLDGPGAADLIGGPRSAREQQVAEIWGELLGKPVHDLDADFFDLGGHSLLAARAVSDLRWATGLRIALGDLLGAPTVRGLARVLDRTPAADGSD
jgi:amino acid adenylation domain-containing protein